MRAGTWWPLSAALGGGGIAWIVRCARASAASTVWAGVGALGLAYAVALASDVAAVDLWAAPFGALLLLTAELAHAAAGAPAMESADPATRGRYAWTAAGAVVAGLGAAFFMLAAAESGGSGGAEVTALGAACAAAALALLAASARRTAVP